MKADGTLIKRYAFTDGIIRLCMPTESQVVVPLVRRKMLAVIDLKKQKVCEYPYTWLSDASRVQLFAFPF